MYADLIPQGSNFKIAPAGTDRSANQFPADGSSRALVNDAAREDSGGSHPRRHAQRACRSALRFVSSYFLQSGSKVLPARCPKATSPGLLAQRAAGSMLDILSSNSLTIWEILHDGPLMPSVWPGLLHRSDRTIYVKYIIE